MDDVHAEQGAAKWRAFSHGAEGYGADLGEGPSEAFAEGLSPCIPSLACHLPSHARP